MINDTPTQKTLNKKHKTNHNTTHKPTQPNTSSPHTNITYTTNHQIKTKTTNNIRGY